jgi:polysaccharide export outer membrane protein
LSNDHACSNRRRGVFTLALLATLAACSSYLPEDGPRRDVVLRGAAVEVGATDKATGLPYVLVRVNATVLSQLVSEDTTPSFSTAFTQVGPRGGGIGVGDLVGVTIFESGAGGLFIPAEPGTRNSNAINLPNQQVDNGGNITVPYAGDVHVAGMTAQGVARTIEARLSGRALDPQAIVSVTERRANAVSVTGDLNASAHFSIDPGGERLLGALSRAGGPKFPAYETNVTINRHGVSETALLSDITRTPSQNVQLQPGDAIYVQHAPRYFLALGALGPGQYLGLINRRLNFDDSRLSLADAMARVGGLEDDRANARAVFVYRFEHRDRLAALGGTLPPSSADVIPTIYLVDLVDPAGYFLANRFQMRNEDLIFVSNAPETDLTKFLNVVLPIAYSTYNFRH